MSLESDIAYKNRVESSPKLTKIFCESPRRDWRKSSLIGKRPSDMSIDSVESSTPPVKSLFESNPKLFPDCAQSDTEKRDYGKLVMDSTFEKVSDLFFLCLFCQVVLVWKIQCLAFGSYRWEFTSSILFCCWFFWLFSCLGFSLFGIFVVWLVVVGLIVVGFLVVHLSGFSLSVFLLFGWLVVGLGWSLVECPLSNLTPLTLLQVQWEHEIFKTSSDCVMTPDLTTKFDEDTNIYEYSWVPMSWLSYLAGKELYKAAMLSLGLASITCSSFLETTSQLFLSSRMEKV